MRIEVSRRIGGAEIGLAVEVEYLQGDPIALASQMLKVIDDWLASPVEDDPREEKKNG